MVEVTSAEGLQARTALELGGSMSLLQARRAIIENARRQVELATRLVRDGIYDSACFHAMTAIEECASCPGCALPRSNCGLISAESRSCASWHRNIRDEPSTEPSASTGG